jgi:alkylation response protein AidB-like acyl-CoA dehydrogenase
MLADSGSAGERLLDPARDHQLLPVTDAGRRWVAIAESALPAIAERAREHDAAGTFPHESIRELQANGFLAGQVPESLGGLGATSVHDWVVAMTRLARADAAVAISANMHLLGTWRQVRIWDDARARGDHARLERLEGYLRAVGEGRLISCGTTTEPGTSLVEPRTALTRNGDGWILNGRKGFGTMSPAADVIFVTARMPGDDGGALLATVVVPTTSPGVTVLENWDALGMRASGSNDVEFADVEVPADSVVPSGPYGELTPHFLTVFGPGVLGLVGAFAGIAEAARGQVSELLRTRRRGPSGALLATRRQIQHEFGQLEVGLAACRAVVARAGSLLDDYFTRVPESAATQQELLSMMRDVQCAKQFVTREAVTVVDRALTLSGGAGYAAKSPLSRMYRDVRAGSFMQPFSPLEGFEYVGGVGLGVDMRTSGQ